MPDTSQQPRFGPADALAAPRYTGIRTFARCPHVDSLEDVDIAVLGVPFDTATSFRPGTRFGPEAIRAASILLRPWHPVLEVDVFSQSVVDFGDVPITPGNAERTLEQIAAGVGDVVAAGVVPIVLGGDHSIVLGELRAHARRHGPVGLVLLDAHADTWDQYYGERYFHGTPFRRALEEGLLDPTRSLIAGMRGALYEAADLGYARDAGFEVLTGPELRKLTPSEYGQRVRERIGAGPTFLSLDIDVFDPSVAPGTGTPEVGGLHAADGLELLRSLVGIEFVGYDLVEVSPPYDGTGQPTALLAANLVHEFLALSACATRDAAAAEGP